jgi:hypothetical protein
MRSVYVALLGVVVLLGGCGGEDGIFDSLKPRASVYYYNQITSNGAANEDDLTVDFTVKADDEDSVSDQGYSRGEDAKELRVRIDDNEDNNSVSLRGYGQSGAELFRDQVRFTNEGVYTAVSYGDTSQGNVRLSVFKQDESEVPSGSARFRVINTVDPVQYGRYGISLRYSAEQEPFAPELRRGDATEYQTVNNGKLSLVVADSEADPEEVLARVDCSLSGSSAYDVILTYSDPLNLPTRAEDLEDNLALYCHKQDEP